MENNLILDIGCGDLPRGNINLDKSLYSPEIGGQNRVIKTKANIIGNALDLPFIDNIFYKVICSHVIEHTTKPLELLKECLRVSNNIIYIETPHILSVQARKKYHKSYFTINWFKTALKNYSYRLILNYDIWYIPPKRFRFHLPFKRPNNIKVYIFK